MNPKPEDSIDPYEVLHLEDNASFKDVKNKYQSFSLAFHPDKQPNDLFQESAEQFDKVKQAYKILSNPIQKYVFDKYGAEGIKIYNENLNKFRDLEKDYKYLVIKHEELLQDEDASDIEKVEVKAQLKHLKHKIRENLEFYSKLIEEEEINRAVTRELFMSLGIDFEDYYNFYVKGSDEAEKLKEKGLYPVVNYGNFNMYHWASLPEFKGIQHSIGVYGAYYNKKYQTSYGIKYRFRKTLSSLYNIDFMGLATCNEESSSFTPTLSKTLPGGVSLNASTVFTGNGFGNSSLTASKKIGKDLSLFSSFQYDDDSNLLTGITKEWPSRNLKSETVLDIYKDKVRVSQSFTKVWGKRLEGFIQTNQYLSRNYVYPQLVIGYGYRFSSISKISLSSVMAASSVGLEVRYTRLKFKIKLPINIASKFDPKASLISLAITGVAFWLTRLYENRRLKSKKYFEKLMMKNEDRLSDGKRIFHELVATLNGEANNIVNHELPRKGIIVLQALYGSIENIKSHYLNELKAHNYNTCFKTDKEPAELLSTNIQGIKDINDLELIQIIDVRVLMQILVVNSRFKISLGEFAAINGVFNPNIDGNAKAILFLKIYMNGKIFLACLDDPDKKLELNRDYDQYLQNMGESTPNSFNVYNWLSSFFV